MGYAMALESGHRSFLANVNARTSTTSADETFADALRRAKNRLGCSNKQLARALHCTPRAVDGLLAGNSDPSFRIMIAAIARLDECWEYVQHTANRTPERTIHDAAAELEAMAARLREMRR